MAKELYGLKILVVDDDVDTRELIDWVLRRAGAEVTCRSPRPRRPWRPSSATAPHPGQRHRDAGGGRLLSLMRQIRALPPEHGGRIPAVALTAHSMVQDRLQSLRAGFQSHVPKPVVPEELVEVVASIIHLRSSRTIVVAELVAAAEQHAPRTANRAERSACPARAAG